MFHIYIVDYLMMIITAKVSFTLNVRAYDAVSAIFKQLCIDNKTRTGIILNTYRYTVHTHRQTATADLIEEYTTITTL